ncbi:hypothetical protein CsatB_024152 [Cannabis sativa]
MQFLMQGTNQLLLYWSPLGIGLCVIFTKKMESISKWKSPIHNNIVKITTKLTEVAKRCVVTRANATMFQI